MPVHPSTVSTVWACLLGYVYVDRCIHASMLLHVHISIFMSVFVSVSRAELRWATACCSAVTTPALVCIIYPPADWSRERHNHSNQGHAHIHTPRGEKHRLYCHGGGLISKFICFSESPAFWFSKSEKWGAFEAPQELYFLMQKKNPSLFVVCLRSSLKQTTKRDFFFSKGW